MCASKSELELYRVYRDYIVHEDTLIGSRINWLTVSQPFLFASYSLSLSAGFEPKGMERLATMQEAVCWLGMLLSGITLISVLASVRSMISLKASWAAEQGRAPSVGDKAEASSNLPAFTAGGSQSAHYMGLAATLGLPGFSLFIWFWLYSGL